MNQLITRRRNFPTHWEGMMPPSNRPSSIKTNSTTTAKKDAASNEQPQTPLSSHTPKSSNNNNSTIFASSKQTSPHFRKKQLKTASNPTLWYTTTDKLFVKASSKQPQTTNTTIPTKAKNQEHALRHKLAKKLSELTEEQDIEEKKFRNAGRKVRDEKVRGEGGGRGEGGRIFIFTNSIYRPRGGASCWSY